VIALELLIGSALGELSSEDEERVEEHVVSCGACAARYASFVRLGPAIDRQIRTGGMTMVVTRALAAKLEAEGLVSRRYVLGPGERVACTVTPEDIYSLTRFEADLTSVSRLDMRGPFRNIVDVPFDRDAGCIYTLTSATVLLPLPTADIPFTLHAIEPDGSERLLGRYTMGHTAYQPSA